MDKYRHIMFRLLFVTAACFFAVMTACNGKSSKSTPNSIQDIKHVVIIIQENRSFDHYFGTLKGVRGYSDPSPLILQSSGQPIFYQPDGLSYVLPFHSTSQNLVDQEHDWTGLHQVWNSGKWDQWIPKNGTNSMLYFTRDDLKYYYELADAYTICDSYFSSVIGPTYPNRLYLFSGTIDPAGTGGGPAITNVVPTGGFTWTTYPERLQSAGVTWKVYRPDGGAYGDALTWFANYKNASPGDPLYDLGVATVTDTDTAFIQDLNDNKLPQVTWVVPTIYNSEHPPCSPANGEVYVKKILDAIAANPETYKSTVCILTFDEAGGYFDHVVPPLPPVGTPDEYVSGLPIGLGLRLPMIIISPWTRGGYVCSDVFDHTSILRFLETWTGVAEPNISAWRRQVCGDLTSAFDFSKPDYSIPAVTAVTPVNGTGVVIPVPTVQSMPTQEPGTKLSRP